MERRFRRIGPIDGVNQLDFFLGKHEHSNREGFPAYVADRLSAVKWRNWKVHFIWQEHMYDPPLTLPLPKVINLLTDLKEERDGFPGTTHGSSRRLRRSSLSSRKA